MIPKRIKVSNDVPFQEDGGKPGIGYEYVHYTFHNRMWATRLYFIDK